MKQRVLRKLKQHSSGFVSGEEMCRQMGVSRTAIWKHINSLRGDGYIINSQSNLGYSLQGVPDKLYPAEIREGLTTTSLGREIYYYDILKSTNGQARDLADSGALDGSLVVAEEQGEGRGRLGRGWFSPAGMGIWCSLILRPRVMPSEAPPVTMLTAVAVSRAVSQVAGIRADIKWPNDLLVNGKKLCGILTEMNAELERVNYLVVGAGINVNTSSEAFPVEIGDIATSIRAELGYDISRVKLLRAYLQQFEELYHVWLSEGFAPVLAEWRQKCVTLNCSVTIKTLKETINGWAKNVDTSGALEILLPDGSVRTFVAGEVSLRKA